MSWIRLLGSEVRGSFLFRSGVPLVVVGAVVAQSVASPGLFVWEDRAGAAITSLAVLVPLITGVAVLDTLRIRRAGLGPLWRLSRDSGARAISILLLAQALLAAVIVALVAVGAHLPLGVGGLPAGGPVLVWLAAGCAAGVLAAMLGALLGIVVPYLPTALAAPIAAYVGFALLFVLPRSSTGVGPSRLSPMYQKLVDPYYFLDWTPIAWQLAWFVAAGLALGALVVFRVTGARAESALALGATVAVALATGLVVASDERDILLDRRAAPPRCEGTAPRLCLPSPYEPARKRISTVLVAARERVAGTALTFDLVDVRPRGYDPRPSSAAVPLHMDDLGDRWAVRDVYELAGELLGADRGYCRGVDVDPAADPFESARVVVRSWVAGDETGRLSGFDDFEAAGIRRALTAFTAMPRSERISWLDDNREGVCSGLLPMTAIDG